MQGGGFDVSFTKDGNLFKTLASSYVGGSTAFVNAVIASVPGGKITDTLNSFDTPANSGYHTLSSSDFSTSNGAVSWFGAKAWVNYLNSISYGGSNQWSLPSWADTGATGAQFGYNGTDFGYNVNTSSNPLAQLYYGELNKKAPYNTSGTSQSGYGIFSNNGAQVAGGAVGPFTNVQSLAYWSDTEVSDRADLAWDFETADGQQNAIAKINMPYAWAITPGQVATVPIPGAVWLFSSGLLGLLGFKRRTQAA